MNEQGTRRGAAREAKLRKKQETEQENGGQTEEERCKGGAKRSTITVYIRRSASLIDLKPRRTLREWRRWRRRQWCNSLCNRGCERYRMSERDIVRDTCAKKKKSRRGRKRKRARAASRANKLMNERTERWAGHGYVLPLYFPRRRHPTLASFSSSLQRDDSAGKPRKTGVRPSQEPVDHACACTFAPNPRINVCATSLLLILFGYPRTPAATPPRNRPMIP